jgi:CheY-like chemotaxis protein
MCMEIMKRILLVDDDPLVRGTLHAMLARSGYQVEDADNGESALEAFAREPHDVVITDLVMPDMEGLETIRELRRRFGDVRIIAISGGGVGSASHYLQAAKRLGAVRVLSKPFSNDEILAAVEEALA